jgi:hypothetical protein
MSAVVRTVRALAALTFVLPTAIAQTPALEVTDASNTRLLMLDTSAGLVVHGVFNEMPVPETIPATGAGTRLMWWPSRAAFRAGMVEGTEWDASNVGLFSLAMGLGTAASGSYATAIGYQTTASFVADVALGYQTTAIGGSATAMGQQTTASAVAATAMGSNSTASGNISTAMGFRTTASGGSSTAMGSRTTASGNNSTAMGSNATTGGFDGSFVIGDFSTVLFNNALVTATAENQFTSRFAGGYRLYTSAMSTTTGVTLGPGQGSWASLSDSTRKERFLSYDPDAVLAGLRGLRLGTWNYRGQDPAMMRHWGPMAQDFHRAFGRDGVGVIGTDTTISTQDADGVLFAAAQALEARTRDLEARIEALEAERRRERTLGGLAVAGLLGIGVAGAARRRSAA